MKFAFYIPSRSALSRIMEKYSAILVYGHESCHIWAKNETQVLIEVGALDQHVFNHSCEFQTKSTIISSDIIFFVTRPWKNSEKLTKIEENRKIFKE